MLISLNDNKLTTSGASKLLKGEPIFNYFAISGDGSNLIKSTLCTDSDVRYQAGSMYKYTSKSKVFKILLNQAVEVKYLGLCAEQENTFYTIAELGEPILFERGVHEFEYTFIDEYQSALNNSALMTMTGWAQKNGTIDKYHLSFERVNLDTELCRKEIGNGLKTLAGTGVLVLYGQELTPSGPFNTVDVALQDTGISIDVSSEQQISPNRVTQPVLFTIPNDNFGTSPVKGFLIPTSFGIFYAKFEDANIHNTKHRTLDVKIAITLDGLVNHEPI